MPAARRSRVSGSGGPLPLALTLPEPEVNTAAVGALSPRQNCRASAGDLRYGWVGVERSEGMKRKFSVTRNLRIGRVAGGALFSVGNPFPRSGRRHWPKATP